LDATTGLGKQRIGHRSYVLGDDAPRASGGPGRAETATVQQILPTAGATQHRQRVEQAGFEATVAVEVLDQLLLERRNRACVTESRIRLAAAMETAGLVLAKSRKLTDCRFNRRCALNCALV
jgi:hypothetical protein